MKSITDILTVAGASAAQAQAARSLQRSTEAEKARPFRVHLCFSHFLEIEVGATTAEAAETQALALAAEAKLKFVGGPCAYRTEILVRSDPGNPESPLVWVTVPKSQETPR